MLSPKRITSSFLTWRTRFRMNMFQKQHHKFLGPFGLLVLILAFPNYSLLAQNPKAKIDTVQTVLFICEHGAARSVIASAYFNKVAQEKGLKYRAIFRGTDPDTMLTPATIKGLAHDGFDVKKWKPTKVTQHDVVNADEIVTFDCTIPAEIKSVKPLIKWDGIPAISVNYGVARDQIKSKVESLINELDRRKK